VNVDYPGLRRLFSAGERTTTEAVARAAREGEVVLLALRADPGLAPWLEAPARRQLVIDATLEQALAVAAEVLQGAPVVLLKGTAAGRLVYPDSALRFRRDLDLLVADLRDVRARLLRIGFVDRVDPARAAAGPASVRAWPMAWRAPFGEVELDLHQRVLAYPWCELGPAALLAHAIPATPLPITDPLDTLVHTAVHLVDSGLRQPLKAWVDVHRLAAVVDARALCERARAYRAHTATWAVLDVCQRWFGTTLALPPPVHAAALRFLLGGMGAHPHRRLLAHGRARDVARLLLADDVSARARYLLSRLV